MRELALLEQMQQIPLDFRFAQTVRALTMELRKLRYPFPVGLARAQRQSAHDDVGLHLLAQRAHLDLLYQSREHSQVEPDTAPVCATAARRPRRAQRSPCRKHGDRPTTPTTA